MKGKILIMIKAIKPEKMKEFLESFSSNPKEWYKMQLEEDFEFDEETQMSIIQEKFYTKSRDFSIEFIKNPTEKVCLEVVKQRGDTIKYIKNPTERICIEAIKQGYGTALKYIANPTEEMFLNIVKQNCWAIAYIKNPTERVCIEAVKKDGDAMQFIKKPTERVCFEAIKGNGYAIEYIKKVNQNFDIIQKFFDFDWVKNGDRKHYYEYLNKKFITKEQGLIMIEDDPENINLLSNKVQMEILKMKPELGKYVDKNSINDDFFE